QFQCDFAPDPLGSAGHNRDFSLEFGHAGDIVACDRIGLSMRTRLHGDPANVLLHNAILEACRTYGRNEAIVDTSSGSRITYEQYGDLVEACARGLVRAGIARGDVIAIYLPNCWEYAVAYHAATLAGAVPTLVNPSYREREVRYQLENSEACLLISDAPLL